MNTKAITLSAAVSALSLAAFAENAPVRKPIKISQEKIRQLEMKRFGGYINDTRKQKGSVVVVNAQKAAEASALEQVLAELRTFVKFSLEVKDGSFDLVKPEVQGSASVFVVDDPALPMSLIAPESKWAMVNVAPLKAGEGAKPQFFKARTQKELMRALAYLMGSADSSYPGNIVGCVTKPEDLDQFTDYRLPVDVMTKFTKYVKGFGIEPYERTSYKKSVREGWGPQPTNEFQKAIWDEVHELPSNPIKIKFDPKRDK